MTETAAHGEPQHGATMTTGEAHPAVQADPFDRDDVAEFKASDTEAASTIGKMLVAFFFYSLVVMACVAWWAYSVSGTGNEQSPANAPATPSNTPANGAHH